jgi:uncharacterized protein YndB with AHSA1/START domain
VPAERVVAAGGVCAGSPEQLWRLLSDPKRFAEWADATRAVLRSDDPLGVGGVYVERNRLLGPLSTTVTYTVEEADEPRWMLHRAEGFGLTSSMHFFVELTPVAEPEAPGVAATRVRLGLRYVPALGPLGDVLTGVIRPQLQRGFERSVANVARIAARERI